jgi:hypothetical protein
MLTIANMMLSDFEVTSNKFTPYRICTCNRHPEVDIYVAVQQKTTSAKKLNNHGDGRLSSERYPNRNPKGM